MKIKDLLGCVLSCTILSFGSCYTNSTESENLSLTDRRNEFISKWKGKTIVLPIYDGGQYDFKVNWGDGQIDHISSYRPLSHTYKTHGEHIISITGKIEGFNFGKVPTSKDQIISIEKWGNLKLLNSVKGKKPVIRNHRDQVNSLFSPNLGCFQACTNLKSVPSSSPKLEGVTDMSNMFRDATSFKGDISQWNVENVTDMNSMFNGAKVFNGDISKWNVKNVTTMSSIFWNASSFNGDISQWNVENVTVMFGMFSGAKVFNRDISQWNVENVTNMIGMFGGAKVFNGDISKWNVENVTNMAAMFYGAKVFNSDIGKWDVSRVANMENMFLGAEAFNQNIGSWDVKNVSNMSGMFHTATSFDQDISKWDVRNVTNMCSMFIKAASFKCDISRWNVENVTHCAGFSEYNENTSVKNLFINNECRNKYSSE
ncbi:BspA family leucine-rich repeat surface protein [Ichthyobacterium seriolicida]|uniref:BspA family leucine-rich repeat surface protein n=1 Tax=Ichthyobacterium seriolicida TaxID=242600 RepID=UPI000BBC9C5C|nr:BspA family leucine-rich repeat surface protein [Ichthyobacterium seriolicida]